MRIENLQPISLHKNNSTQMKEKSGVEFADLFKQAIQDVNQVQKNANQVAEAFAVGQIEDTHQVTIAAEQASLALELTVAIRNKVVDAYKEIMRMQF